MLRFTKLAGALRKTAACAVNPRFAQMIKEFTRTIARTVTAASQSYAVIILTGPRQTGKTTLLRSMCGPIRNYVTLDDPNERGMAQSDPRSFLQVHRPPLLIDEVQYAPELFSFIKMAADNGAPPGSFWLTGSQVFSMMQLAQESLAGRAAVLNMSALSQSEIAGTPDCGPFSLEISDLQERARMHGPVSTEEIYRRIWLGGLPGLVSGRYPNRDLFFSSYLQTYVSRDLTDIAPSLDKYNFLNFVRAAACRCATSLNLSALARDADVSVPTVTRWVSILQKSGIVYLLHPYSNNLLKRTVKAPKLYFFDTGLVAYLTQFVSPEALSCGVLSGAICENFVINEIRKSYSAAGRECLMWYYRDADQAEIDLIIGQNGILHPIEIKRSGNPTAAMARHFGKLARSGLPVGTGAVICSVPALGAVSREVLTVPVSLI